MFDNVKDCMIMQKKAAPKTGLHGWGDGNA